MKKFTKVILPALVLAMTGQVAQAVDIKQAEIDTCISRTVASKIADKKNASRLCNCTVDIRSNMTIGQTWEIESYAQSGKDPSVLPYVRAMQKKINKCTKGLILQAPQQR